MIIRAVTMGMKLRLAISIGLIPAIPAEATNTPDTGDMVLPIEAANCIGNNT
jgi:hypothetical protein